jgi:hypothetical protein
MPEAEKRSISALMVRSALPIPMWSESFQVLVAFQERLLAPKDRSTKVKAQLEF